MNPLQGALTALESLTANKLRSALTILGTFLSDVLLALLDPRIRYGERI